MRIDWEAKFEKYHEKNPHVYELFKKFTYETIDAGFTNMSAQMVINRLRWYANFETKGDPFKINSNYSAYYARKFMDEHPRFSTLFSTRKLKKDSESIEEKFIPEESGWERFKKAVGDLL